MKILKIQNRKWIISYVLFQVSIILVYYGTINFTIENINEFFVQIYNPKSVFILLSFPLAILFEGLISSSVKEFFIFWRIKNRLPGHRAFSVHALKDSRINYDSLGLLFNNDIPQEPKLQNTEWYNLYKKNQSKETVIESHRNYLLMRDFAIITLLFIPIFIIIYFLIDINITKYYMNIVLNIVLYFLFMIASRNYANRFITNVLTEELAE